jgi:hypothetical protein
VSLLWQIAGVEDLPPPEATVPAEARALLVEHARLFLAAGGTLSLVDWDQLDDDQLDDAERCALAFAGRERDVKQAVRIGRASQGPLGALRVQAEIDGGEAHDEAQLGAAVDALAKGLNRGS